MAHEITVASQAIRCLTSYRGTFTCPIPYMDMKHSDASDQQIAEFTPPRAIGTNCASLFHAPPATQFAANTTPWGTPGSCGHQLPARDDPDEISAGRTRTARADMAATMIRILFIDDSPDDVEQCITVLRHAKQPIKAQRVDDVAEFRNALAGAEWDLVLAEAVAGRLTARQVLNMLKTRHPDIPVIVVARQVTDADIQEIMAEGARDVVVKGQWARLLPVVRRELRTAEDRRISARVADSLRQLEDRYRVMVEGSREAVCYCHDGMHVDANPAYLALVGCHDLLDLKGVPILNLIDKKDQARFKSQLRSPDSYSGSREYTAVTSSAQRLPVEITMSSVRIEGEPCVQIVVTDISRRKALETKLQFLHQRDALTGLCNRHYFLQELGKVMDQVRSDNGSGFLIGLELRSIAEINRALGHAACDRLLLMLTRQLSEHLTAQQLFARVGGGKFSVLLHGNPRDAAESLAAKLRQTANTFQFADGARRVECHLGLTLVEFDKTAPDCQQLLALAFPPDKAEPPGHLSSPAITQTIAVRPPAAETNPALQRALLQERFRLMFQPLVNLHGEPRELYEACPFVEMDDGALLARSEFMPLAARLGVACNIDRWVAQKAIEALARSMRQGNNPELFIPVSACGVNDPMLLPAIQQHLKTTHLDPARLHFQIAAPVIKSHPSTARAFLRQAKETGAGIVLDDFDPMLLKVAELADLPIGVIKIDCGSGQGTDEATLRHAAHDAKASGRISVAKSVDDMSVFTLLWNCSFDYVQGSCINPPVEQLNHNFESEHTLTSEVPLANPWQASG